LRWHKKTQTKFVISAVILSFSVCREECSTYVRTKLSSLYTNYAISEPSKLVPACVKQKTRQSCTRRASILAFLFLHELQAWTCIKYIRNISFEKGSSS